MLRKAGFFMRILCAQELDLTKYYRHHTTAVSSLAYCGHEGALIPLSRG